MERYWLEEKSSLCFVWLFLSRWRAVCIVCTCGESLLPPFTLRLCSQTQNHLSTSANFCACSSVDYFQTPHHLQQSLSAKRSRISKELLHCVVKHSLISLCIIRFCTFQSFTQLENLSWLKNRTCLAACWPIRRIWKRIWLLYGRCGCLVPWWTLWV